MTEENTPQKQNESRMELSSGDIGRYSRQMLLPEIGAKG
jgi:hypothetical protein